MMRKFHILDNSKKNVFWFLIDGLSPNFLNSCGNNNVEPNFIDKLINRGFVFTNVASTAAGTHTSMHSVFSSMYASVNGASGWNFRALRKFNPYIFTLTDFFKQEGYSTFRYGDAKGERDVPKSGFDVWESSGYTITELLERTNYTDTARRREFIKKVNECKNSKFVYHHCLILHELNGKLGAIWPSDCYIDNVKKTASVFEKIFGEYNISDDDLVIISSDYGVILDLDFISDGDLNGERHYEQSVRTFFALVGRGIPKGISNGLISSIDESPTILKLLFDIKMPGQGVSRLPILHGDSYDEPIVFREKGTYCSKNYTNSLSSDVFYVRKGNWKYIYGIEDERCEWLIDLREGDYCINHKNDKEKVDYFRNLLEKQFTNISVEDIYRFNGFNKSPKKHEIKFTLVIDKKNLNKEVYDSLADLAGPYYEVIILNGTSNHLRYNFRNFSGKLGQLSSSDVCGEIIVYLNSECVYSEYLLSDIYIQFVKNSSKDCLVFETGFAVQREYFENYKELSKRKINIREYEKKIKYRYFPFKIFSRNNIIIDFYLIDSFEIFHFMPFYYGFVNVGFDVKFIAEPCCKNTAKTWFDYSNAVKILEDNNLAYSTRYRKRASIVFTTQDSYLLQKYDSTSLRINLSYGFSFKKDYFIHSKRTTDGFDYRFVHGDLQKQILSQYMDEERILKVGYPKYFNRLSQLPSRNDILREIGITTEKPILVYFPTWDEDNTIDTYANEIEKLKDDYFIITKAHHCTNLSKNPDDYKILKKISNVVLDGNFDFVKAALLGDVCIADAKSGASLEVAYINGNIPIALLFKTKDDDIKYSSEIKSNFTIINEPGKLKAVVDKIRYEDIFARNRDCIIRRCYGIKNYDYMPIIIEFINWAAKKNKLS